LAGGIATATFSAGFYIFRHYIAPKSAKLSEELIGEAKYIEAENAGTEPDLEDSNSDDHGAGLISFIAILQLMEDHNLVKGKMPPDHALLKLKQLAYHLGDYSKR